VRVEAVLLDDPRVVPPKGDTLAFQQLVVARLRVEVLEVAGERVELRQPVMVFGSDPHWLGLLPSQRVRAEGRLRPFSSRTMLVCEVSRRAANLFAKAPHGYARQGSLHQAVLALRS